jgi:hypothetical protein
MLWGSCRFGLRTSKAASRTSTPRPRKSRAGRPSARPASRPAASCRLMSFTSKASSASLYRLAAVRAIVTTDIWLPDRQRRRRPTTRLSAVVDRYAGRGTGASGWSRPACRTPLPSSAIPCVLPQNMGRRVIDATDRHAGRSRLDDRRARRRGLARFVAWLNTPRARRAVDGLFAWHWFAPPSPQPLDQLVEGSGDGGPEHREEFAQGGQTAAGRGNLDHFGTEHRAD